MSAFAKSLRAAMEKSGLSQSQVSEMSGIGQTTISQWATGRSEPTWTNVCLLADALGISVADFRCPDPPVRKVRPRKVRVRVEVEGHPEVSIDVSKQLLPVTRP